MAATHSQTLPYFCDPAEIPGPLPSLEEIEDAKETLPGYFKHGYEKVVRIRDKFVVKYGVTPWVSENEGHALLLLRQHPSIPVPRLYAMYREGDMLFLIMEFKEGIQLSEVWKNMSEADKVNITGQLRDILTQIRSIPSPGIFAGVSGGPLRHRFFLSRTPEPDVNGPFHDEKNFGMAMAIRSKRLRDDHPEHRAWVAEFFARHLPTALAGHSSVFTHADLQRKNILVFKVPPASAEGSGGGGSPWRVSAIVDWEDAGWYPSYWEYAGSFASFAWEDDWPEKFERIVEPCPLEAGLLKFVRQDFDY